MTEFSDLGLAEPLLRAIDAEGYTTPTPIQAKVIPPALEGRDIVGIAQTGTGKTAAFVLPVLHRIQTGNAFPRPKSCTALILAPTRELVAQIADSVSAYGRKSPPALAMIVGGVKPGPQVRTMAPGVDVLVATPGRLIDHMNAGAITLANTKTIILDEADQMMDMGFMPAIRRIMRALPTERQTVLLSATMPKQIRALADDFLNDPTEVSVAPQSKPIDRIEQKIIHTPRAGKKDLLVEILASPEMDRGIVFTRTKHGANKVVAFLGIAGLKATAIHGNKTQGQRMRALHAFKSGETPILVATDVAARGIDIDDVSHVVNFELPNIPESYVHRIGRTARAGRSGIAISFCEGEERGYLRDIERLIKMQIPSEGVLQTEVDPPKPGQNRGRQAPRGDRSRPDGAKRNGPKSTRAKGTAKGNTRTASDGRNDQAPYDPARIDSNGKSQPRRAAPKSRAPQSGRDSAEGDKPRGPNGPKGRRPAAGPKGKRGPNGPGSKGPGKPRRPNGGNGGGNSGGNGGARRGPQNRVA